MVLCAFDGTWNADERKKAEKHTNVVRFRDLYSSRTEPIYHPGPGNSLVGNNKGLLGLFTKFAGGAVANEAGIILRRVYRDLCQNYTEEDKEIDIIGFSRGAAIALSFLWYIQQHGLRVANSNTSITPTVRFVGLFDTVFFVMADLELPQSERLKVRAIRYPILRALSPSPDLSLPSISSRPFHALSLHDRRWCYYPVRISGAHEVWFAGFHGDVGGGGEQPRLSDISLEWMIAKAQSAGVPVSSHKNNEKVPPYPHLDGKYEWGNWDRDVRKNDLYHPSVPLIAREKRDSLADLKIEPEL